MFWHLWGWQKKKKLARRKEFGMEWQTENMSWKTENKQANREKREKCVAMYLSGENWNSDESPKTTTITHFPLDEKFMENQGKIVVFIAVSVLLLSLISFLCSYFLIKKDLLIYNITFYSSCRHIAADKTSYYCGFTNYFSSSFLFDVSVEKFSAKHKI